MKGPVELLNMVLFYVCFWPGSWNLYICVWMCKFRSYIWL